MFETAYLDSTVANSEFQDTYTRWLHAGIYWVFSMPLLHGLSVVVYCNIIYFRNRGSYCICHRYQNLAPCVVIVHDHSFFKRKRQAKVNPAHFEVGLSVYGKVDPSIYIYLYCKYVYGICVLQYISFSGLSTCVYKDMVSHRGSYKRMPNAPPSMY